MKYRQGVQLVSRAIAVYFLFWIANDLILLPSELHTLHHYIQQTDSPRDALSPGLSIYYLRGAILSLAENVLKIALWSLAALSFYRVAPGVQRFFGTPEEATAVKPVSGQGSIDPN